MQWFLFLSILTLAFASPSQCPANLPATCSCECNFCENEPIYLQIHCTTVPDLYELLSILGTVNYFKIKIDKCEKPVQNLTKLPPFYTICLLINHCGLESVADDAFVNVSELELLDLSNNAITKMPVFPHFPLLTYIALNHNMLRDLGEPSATKNYSSFDGVPELTHLYLKNNSLTHITNKSFANLKEICYFDLSNNKLNHIAADAFLSQRNVLEFNLSYNELTYLEPGTFRDMDIYVKLLLNNNRLTHLDANTFAGNKGLEILNISNNQLTYIAPGSFNDLNSLQNLDLSNNSLNSFDGIWNGLTNLRYLQLSHNVIDDISNITFQNLKAVWDVDLSHNLIRKAALNSLDEFEKLNLNNNNLTTLKGAFSTNNRLTNLDLSNNNFVEVTNGSFGNLTQLYKLNLSNNQINYIVPYAFAATKIYELDISNNNLTMLETHSLTTIYGPLKSFKYNGNPFVCDDTVNTTSVVCPTPSEATTTPESKDQCVCSCPCSAV